MNEFGLVHISVHGRPHFEKCLDYIVKNSWACKYTIVFDPHLIVDASSSVMVLKPKGQLIQEITKFKMAHFGQEKVVHILLKETTRLLNPLVTMISSYLDDQRCRVICYEQSIFEAFGHSNVGKIVLFLRENKCQCLFQTCFIPSMPSTLLIVSSKYTLLRSQSSFVIRFIYNCLRNQDDDWSTFFKMCYYLEYDSYLCIQQDEPDKIIEIPDVP